MTALDDTHHFFRHIGKARIDGEFIDPSAFRLKSEAEGKLEEGLSINWVEYFGKPTPEEAVTPVIKALRKKGRTIGGESRFALLNVGAAKAAAAKFAAVQIVTDPEPNDPSHALVKGQHAYNDQIAEELQKVIITTFAARP